MSTYQFLSKLTVSIMEHNMCIIGTVLLNHSKDFDCILHDLLMAKLNAYEFDREALKLIFSYLKGRKQSVRINNVYCNFLELLLSVARGSILGALL